MELKAFLHTDGSPTPESSRHSATEKVLAREAAGEHSNGLIENFVQAFNISDAGSQHCSSYQSLLATRHPHRNTDGREDHYPESRDLDRGMRNRKEEILQREQLKLASLRYKFERENDEKKCTPKANPSE